MNEKACTTYSPLVGIPASCFRCRKKKKQGATEIGIH